MANFDKYRARISEQGNSFGDAFSNDTANYVNATFQDSPYYMVLPIGGTDTECRMQTVDNDSHQRTLTFRPNTVVNEGQIVTYNGDSWLVTRFLQNNIFPSAIIHECNESLRWKDSSNTSFTYPCVLISLHRMVTIAVDKVMETNKYQMRCWVPYNNDTKKIILSQRFLLGGQAFVVAGIDDASLVYDGHGYIELAIEIDIVTSSDDTVNGFADNTPLWTKVNANGNVPRNGGDLW